MLDLNQYQVQDEDLTFNFKLKGPQKRLSLGLDSTQSLELFKNYYIKTNNRYPFFALYLVAFFPTVFDIGQVFILIARRLFESFVHVLNSIIDVYVDLVAILQFFQSASSLFQMA